jgi:hypothetical protein
MGISRTLRRRTKESIMIGDGTIEQIEPDTVWSIKSVRDPARSYFVVRTLGECSGTGSSSLVLELESSNVVGACAAFSLAKACRHTFTCSCHDYSSGSNTCKHVLKLSAFLGLWNPRAASLNTNERTGPWNWLTVFRCQLR